MLGSKFDIGPTRPLRVLCLGAHSDDVEIGCGGTLMTLSRQYPGMGVHVVVLSANEVRADEARAGAERFLAEAGERRVEIERFRDGFFPQQAGEIKELLERLKAAVSPDVIFTHHEKDRHQDHRVVSDLTWNTWRDHLVLEYEIPKYDGDLGTPNCFVPLTAATARDKVEGVSSIFRSQSDKHWFHEELFLGLMRLRGAECRASEGYAEAFSCRKIVLG